MYIKKYVYMNAYAPGEGNYINLMNNDLGSYIDPIWEAINSIFQITLKRKNL